MKTKFKEGDWVAYNWLDEEGNDNWKVGRIVKVENKLMYYNNDGTERSGYIPITTGVKLLTNEADQYDKEEKSEDSCWLGDGTQNIDK